MDTKLQYITKKTLATELEILSLAFDNLLDQIENGEINDDNCSLVATVLRPLTAHAAFVIDSISKPLNEMSDVPERYLPTMANNIPENFSKNN